MIDSAVFFIKKELNAYVRLKSEQTEDKVVMSSLMTHDGNLAVNDENVIVITLVDIEEDAVLKNTGKRHEMVENGYVLKPAPIHLNLYLLFSAYFTANNYQDALRYLSLVIRFFQSRPVFTKNAYPELGEAGLDKLIFELSHTDYQARYNLWNILGAKYMPSVIYKMRTLTVDASPDGQQIPAIKGLENK